ncbi:hypothetical protein AURDEDRAFT_168099 [Auricularia subglabra TFB-10046 SS5]|nr:hypothetical protein AURDEDRAFT_168099 [Auricularia subglabra TFB-10046 SS5]
MHAQSLLRIVSFLFASLAMLPSPALADGAAGTVKPAESQAIEDLITEFNFAPRLEYIVKHRTYDSPTAIRLILEDLARELKSVGANPNDPRPIETLNKERTSAQQTADRTKKEIRVAQDFLATTDRK